MAEDKQRDAKNASPSGEEASSDAQEAVSLRPLRAGLHYFLQPVLMVGVLWYWYANLESVDITFVVSIVAVRVILGILEYWLPARPDWVQRAPERIRNIVMVLFLTTLTVIVAGWYDELLAPPLAELRAFLGADIWPHHWPLLLQVFMVFFLSEFIWYWLHRAEHRWAFVWRVSGHGAHHSFKNLGALNFGVNHPLENFFLVLPAALVELFFGVGIATAGAAILTATLASIAHTNLDLNSKIIGWLFTTNRFHICHHSVVLDESNTNYGCAAIVWDRVFGTFLDKEIEEAGSGPTEPSTWAKFLMPLKEPADTGIAPN